MSDLVAEPEHKEVERELRQMGSMSLFQHLEELRKCIIRSAAAVAVGFGVCWFFAQDKIYPVIEKPILVVFKKYNIDPHLAYLSPTDPFNLYLKVGLMAGIFLASPVILYQVWSFISPGLYRHEKRFVVPFLFLSVGTLFSWRLLRIQDYFPGRHGLSHR